MTTPPYVVHVLTNPFQNFDNCLFRHISIYIYISRHIYQTFYSGIPIYQSFYFPNIQCVQILQYSIGLKDVYVKKQTPELILIFCASIATLKIDASCVLTSVTNYQSSIELDGWYDCRPIESDIAKRIHKQKYVGPC